MNRNELTQPLLSLDVQQRLLIERVRRLEREGIEPVKTRARLRTVQRHQAREFKLHFGR
jgi:hypothetical protein